MKLFLVFALFAAAVTAEEGNIRKRNLVGGSGSLNIDCFSEISSVQVFGEGVVTMKDLQIGDRVLTGDKYQTVYAFAHLDRTAAAEFVQIETTKGETFEATRRHLVFVDGKSGAVRADSIQVGDVLQGATVTKIGSIERTGLYAPLTTDGTLVVGGVKASNYISLEQAEGHALFGANIHGFSHFGISPFRLLCTKLSPGMCTSYSDEGIPNMVGSLHQAFAWFMELPVVLQAVAIAVYLLIAASTWTMECMTSPLLVAAVGFLAAKALGFRVSARKVKTV